MDEKKIFYQQKKNPTSDNRKLRNNDFWKMPVL